ncbi:MAG: histidine kinase [Eubacterium sp.]|nr:histidine kinase [Eubacterium sp.]
MIRIGNLSNVICCAGAVIFLFGFNASEFQKKKDQMFFYMILSAAVMFGANVADSYYNPDFPSLLEKLFQIFIFFGFYALLFFYTAYLVEIIRDQMQNEAESGQRHGSVTAADPGKSGHPVLYRFLFGNAVLCLVSFILWTVSVFTGVVVQMNGTAYSAGPLYLPGQAGGFIIVLGNVILLMIYRDVIGRRATLILATLPMIPLIAAVFEMIFPGPSIRGQCIFLSILIIFTFYHKETERELERRETALLKNRVELMTGRMQPHYLYNVLSTIYYLCEEDPIKAQEAVGLFSEYLRDVLDALQRQEPVTLSWERQALQYYLKLEKMRFGERLQIEYEGNVDEATVFVPPLSVQPLVENAIRHGMEKQSGCVKIKIESRVLPGNPDQVQIFVRDDGVGYEPDQVRYGEGILNVQERLRMQCGGTLQIKSSPGEGTVAEILLPQYT